MTAAAIASMGASAFKSLQGPPPSGPVSMYTPEMHASAVKQYEDYMNRFGAATGVRATGPGGASLTGTREINPQQQKKEAYADYLVVEKGYSPEEAQARANKIAGKKKLTFAQDKGFKKHIRKNDTESLSIKNGKIKAAPKFAGPEINTGEQQQNIQNMMQGLNQQSMMAASGLPFMYAQQEQRGANVRNMMTPMLMQQGMQMASGGMSQPELEGLKAIEDYFADDFKGYFEDLTDQAYSGLYNSGFTSSSLVDDVLNEGAAEPAAEYAAQSAAKLADIRNRFMSDSLARDTQRQQVGLGTFYTLGQMSGIDSVTGALVNPNQFGGMTDAQSLALLQGVRAGDLGNMMQNQAGFSNLLQKPVNIMPGGNERGFLSKFMDPLGLIT